MSLADYNDAGSFYRPGDAVCDACGVFAHPDTVQLVDGLCVCQGCAAEQAAAAERLLQVEFRTCAHEWFVAQAEAARYADAERYFGFRKPGRVAL